MSELNEYIAAGLLHIAGNERVWVPEKIAAYFGRQFGFDVDIDEVNAAVQILSNCGIAIVESDPFAGDFIKISRKRANFFLAAVEKERDPAYEGNKNSASSKMIALSAAIGVNHFVYRPNLDKYNRYVILKRYLEFGDDFILKALGAIANRGFENGKLPASDRTVSPSDNQEAYDQSISSLTEIELELKTSNEAGDIFGDDREVAVQEISTLRNIMASARVRAEPTLALARKCLGWIAEKAGTASVGELAKRALSSIIAWLGF